MDDDFQIQSEVKQSTESISKHNKDKTFQDSQDLRNDKVEDSFNFQMVILAWFFKISSITIYLCLKLLTSLGLQVFVICVILVSLDFWTTKNITGRKLVGLRWYSQITQSGQQQWIFQSRNIKRKAHPANQSAFWISQIVFMAFWIVIFIVNLFTLSFFWVGLAYFCAMLTSLNFGCYFKCRGEHQKKAKDITKRVGLQAAQKMF